MWTGREVLDFCICYFSTIHFLFPPNERLSQSENVTLSLNIILNDALFISKFALKL